MLRTGFVERQEHSTSAAVILRIPAETIPRRTLRRLGREWREYHWWGFTWGHGDEVGVAMGDDAYHVPKCFGDCSSEDEARREAVAWFSSDVTEVAPSDLPAFALKVTGYAHHFVRRERRPHHRSLEGAWAQAVPASPDPTATAWAYPG
jgi:hypothetical protein